jgi:hypothetical protein
VNSPRTELGKWRRLDDAAISQRTILPATDETRSRAGLGLWGAVSVNAPESDFYDLTIFVDLSNSGSSEFHSGKCKRHRGSTCGLFNLGQT